MKRRRRVCCSRITQHVIRTTCDIQLLSRAYISRHRNTVTYPLSLVRVLSTMWRGIGASVTALGEGTTMQRLVTKPVLHGCLVFGLWWALFALPGFTQETAPALKVPGLRD